MLDLRSADDRRGHARFVEDPRQRDLGRADATLFRDLRDAVGDREIRLGDIKTLRDFVSLPAFGRSTPISCQKTARQRTPRNHCHPFIDTQRNHFALFLAIDEVVMVLHRHESRPATRLCDVQHLRKLPAVHARGADVERLAGLHDVVQRFERLLDRRLRVEAMDLVEVDIVGREAAKRGLDRQHDVLAREAAIVRPGTHRKKDLRGDHDVVAAAEFAQGTSDDRFRHTDGIHVGGIEEIDAHFDRALEERTGRFLVQYPWAPARRAVSHGPQTQAGDL